jgi:hypothetical protein
MEEGLLEKVFTLILGQCTDSMRAKLEGEDDYKTISRDIDTIALLKMIKNTVCKFQSQRHPALSLHHGKRQYYMTIQGKFVTNSDYLDQYSNFIDVIEHIGGIIGEEPALLQIKLDRMNIVTVVTALLEQLQTVTEAAKQVYLAVAFLSGSDRNRYGKMLEDLENSYLQGRDECPRTMTAAYNLMVHWRNSTKVTESTGNPGGEGVAFTNVTADEDSKQGTALTTEGQLEKRDISHITCFNCGEKGHYSSDCSNPRRETASQHLMSGYEAGEFEDEGVDLSFCLSTGGKVSFDHNTKPPALNYKKALLQPVTDKNEQRAHRSALLKTKSKTKTDSNKTKTHSTAYRSVPKNRRSVNLEHIMKQSKNGSIDPNWILLDNQSTVEVFYNRRLLRNVREADTVDGHPLQHRGDKYQPPG